MDIKLHANATTTPATRAYIAASSASVSDLSAELGVSETTIRRWRSRGGEVIDRSHRPHDLHASTDPTAEAIIRELRCELALSLDDITEVMRRCVNPKLTRSSIHRCLVRLGLSKRPATPKGPASRPFEDQGCGFIHMDLKHLPRLRGQPAYVFVAIDRATRYVFVEIHTDRTAETTVGFLKRFVQHFPFEVRIILTDNGSEFTDRFSEATRDKQPGKPSGRHPFDKACRKLGIQHRLTKPHTPKTNGMVERFNRRIGEAIKAVKNVHSRRKFNTPAERNAFIHRFVEDYNRTKLRCLGYNAPLQALNNLPGHNTFADQPGDGWRASIRKSRAGFPSPASAFADQQGDGS